MISQVRGRECGGKVRLGRLKGEEGEEGDEGMSGRVIEVAEKLALKD